MEMPIMLYRLTCILQNETYFIELKDVYCFFNFTQTNFKLEYMNCNLQNLPSDVLGEIFSYLFQICPYENMRTKTTLMLATPDIYWIFKRLMDKTHKIIFHRHLHFGKSLYICDMSMNRLKFRIFDALCVEFKKIKNILHCNTKKDLYVHIKNSDSINFDDDTKNKMEQYTNEFLSRTNIPFRFNYLCCGGKGIACTRL